MNDPKSSEYRWSQRGRLVPPDPSSSWFTTHAGPSFVDTATSKPLLYLTGRDSHNRSHIGVFELSVSGGEIRLIENAELDFKTTRGSQSVVMVEKPLFGIEQYQSLIERQRSLLEVVHAQFG